MNEVFTEEVLTDNYCSMRLRLRSFPANRQYERLLQWVLPGRDRNTFRLQGSFAATHPAPVASRFGDSAEVVSPVFDLLDAANSAGCLPELRERLAQMQPDEPVLQQQLAALTVLADVAAGEIDAASSSMAQFVTLTELLNHPDDDTDWPTMLVLVRTVGIPELDLLCAELMLHSISQRLVYFSNPQQDTFFDHLRWLDGLRMFRSVHSGRPESFGRTPDLKHWHSAEYHDSRSRGEGRPHSHWQQTEHDVRKLTGHEMDYLMFRSPLRGSYQVEADISVGAGEKGVMMVAGTRVEAEGSTIKVGTARKASSVIAIKPPLSDAADTVHYRADVNSDAMHVYINGRHVYQTALHPEHAPWIAFRCWRRSRAILSNFAITGQPVVPTSVDLAGDSTLSFWTPYFDEQLGPVKQLELVKQQRPVKSEGATSDSGSEPSGLAQGHWQPLESADGNGICGRFCPELAGTRAEELIRYQRPIIEDGVIEYEFYYRKDSVLTHPAVDRCCFLLQPDGIVRHWLTDRLSERTALSPDNSESLDGVSPLPLKEDQWNRIKLTFLEEHVALELNGVNVLRHRQPTTNPRVFGLFHYADQTEARVRNISWSGDWSDNIQAVEEFELRDAVVEQLNHQAAELSATFHHDFSNGLPSRVFDVDGDETSIQQEADGIRVHRQGINGIDHIRTCFWLKGDFDMEVRFRDLAINPVNGRANGIGLMTFFDNVTIDDLALYRRTQDENHRHRVMFAHKRREADGRVPFRGTHIAEECASGRLRLARRGTMLYGLVAEDDSRQFRLVGSYEMLTPGDHAFRTRLPLQCGSQSHVAVVWRDLSIRAEQILYRLPDKEAQVEILRKLDSRRDQLTANTIHFADESSQAQYSTSPASAVDRVTRHETGIRVTSDGSSERPAVYQSYQSVTSTTIDVEATLHVRQIDSPLDQRKFSEAALLIPVNSTYLHYATIILRRKHNNVLEVVAQTYEREPSGRNVFRVHRALPVKHLTSMRIVIDDGVLWFVYSADGSPIPQVLAEVPFKGSAQPTGIYLRTEASGSDRKVEVDWKSLSVYRK